MVRGFQSIIFMNRPAMLQRKAVAIIARIPRVLVRAVILFFGPIFDFRGMISRDADGVKAEDEIVLFRTVGVSHPDNWVV
jgi:hypothetical protein